MSVLFGVLITSAILSLGSSTDDVNISALLNSFQRGYDKRVRPNYGGQAVVVGITMYVLSISSLSEVQMDFTLDMYFRQFWTDPRLSFQNRPGLEKLVVGAEYIKLMWVPDTFFVNEKTAYFHEATTENQFLRILHTGEILRSIRLTITANCPMNLQYFPLDRQLCYIEIESFGYTMNDIHYRWNDGLNSVQIASDVSLPQFKVVGHRQKTIEASLSTGNYSRLACEIQFTRSMGYYLIQIYIPSSLIVIISWVSFWFNRGASVARVNLGVTTVLTMTTLIASTNAALPKVSYVKSIDVYLGACFFLVFTSLLEYATVGYMAKRIQMQKNRYINMKKIMEMAKLPNDPGVQVPLVLPILQSAQLDAKPVPPTSQQGSYLNNAAFYNQNINKHIVPFQNNLRDEEEIDDPRIKFGLGVKPKPTWHKHQHEHEHEHEHHHHHHHSEYHHEQLNQPLLPPLPPPPPPPPPTPAQAPVNQIPEELSRLLGMTPSDIDKYSRIFFPITFTCFQLMYWIIYNHLSDDETLDGLIFFNGK